MIRPSLLATLLSLLLILRGAGLARGMDGDAETASATAQTAPEQTPAPRFSYWNAYFQSTYLWQRHPGFSAPYDGPHSLVHTAESGYTLTATLFVGLRPWRGTEIYLNPEVIQSEEFSELHGLGGFSNSENQKNGGPMPRFYIARAFLRQTFNLGGQTVETSPGPNQLGGWFARRRLVVTAGQLSVIDVFDNNAYAHDGRTQFMNWMFMTHSASDYAADARGYTWGIAVEYYHDDWAFRLGRFAQPKESNGLALDFNLWKHYGDNLEIEHAHSIRGRPGKLRLMGGRNHARMAAFAESVDFATAQNKVPDLADVRRDQTKYAVGLAFEQAINADIGVFGRFSWNDGRTETYAFTEVDHAFTAGGVAKGRYWRRPDDAFGVALALEGISGPHREYLDRGGLGPFLGDGQLANYALERVLEVYYACAPVRGLWTSVGYQLIGDPGYNADRGPVSIFTIRVHAEY
jgi:high affinity Mn2+ porin